MAKSKNTDLKSLFASPPTESKAQPSAPTGPGASEADAQYNLPPKASKARDSHPGKRGVMIYIPEDMHRQLRKLSVEDDGEPITKIVERGLRDYLVSKGYTKYG